MNWSLGLNFVLLIGVLIAIVRSLRMRGQERLKLMAAQLQTPQASQATFDDIVAVRKISLEDLAQQSRTPDKVLPSLYTHLESNQQAEAESIKEDKPHSEASASMPSEQDTVVMFLQAKPGRQLAGYDLLQAVLSVGFRFGQESLFHRYQQPNGQGAIMCSLATATSTGVFDMGNIGEFTVKGLCLFMNVSGDKDLDAERFDTMMDTSKTLSEVLDTFLLDDEQKPLSELSIDRYHRRLSLLDTV